jgi:ferredoxin
MSETYTSWQLYFDGSATPALRSEQPLVHPGSPYPEPAPDDKLFLCSGFSGLHPDSDLLLSPALQLNGDLTDLNRDSLAIFGRAELNRLTSLSFCSYTVKADPSVIVLAADAEQLNEFLEIYGGVLQVTPLLLSKKVFCQDFDTISEPKISQTAASISVSYRVRAPLDSENCSLCGKCAALCPEQCISEQLFFDLSRCSLCNECVRVCPENAIDLHAVQEASAVAAALLLLDDLPVDDSGSRIFRQDSLDKLFATVFDCEIDEVITCERGICQYSGRLQTGCSRCLSVCPVGAISTSRDGIVIDQLQCTECGACAAVCPTGAIQYLRFSDRSFIDFFADFSFLAGMTVVLGSEEHFHKFWWQNGGSSASQKFSNTVFVEFPEIQALTAMHLLFLLSRGVLRVILAGESVSVPLQEQVSAVNTVFSSLFALSEEKKNPVMISPVNALSVLLSVPQSAEPVLKTPLLHASFTDRRQLLISLFRFLQEQSGRTVQLSGKPFAAFGTIECDSTKCTLCLACLNECRISVLESRAEDWSLNHRSLACVQCGVCVAVCPEDALQRKHGLTLDQQAFDSQQLAQAEPMTCRSCGKVFGTRQSFDRVMQLLDHKNNEAGNQPDSRKNMDIFQYCETCRVVKLYEDEAQQR